MKRSLKLTISVLLLLCYLASPVSVMAHFVETEMVSDNVKKIAVSDTQDVVIDAVGTLEVVLDLKLPLSMKTERTVKLALVGESDKVLQELNVNLQKANPEQEKEIEGKNVQITIQKSDQSRQPVEEGKEYQYLNIKFDGLKTGNYKVKLSGESFVDYTSEKIELNNYSRRLVITNTKGMFALGDVNADKKIDETDYDLLMSKIGSTGADLAKFDLNSDGVIDIIDLNYIAENIKSNSTKNDIERANPIVNSDNLDMKETGVGNETILEGNISNLFDQTEEVVGLKNSDDTPIKEKPVVLTMQFKEALEAEKISIAPSAKENYAYAPSKMEIEILTEDGETINKTYDYKEQTQKISLLRETEEETIVINIGKQVAIKKIVIKVVEVRDNRNLAEIAEVEFLNNVYEELPPPKMDIPEGLTLTAASESITAKWNHAINVTGYKVKVSGGKADQVLNTTKNTITISGDSIKNYTEYSVSVESINGNWESGYCEAKKVTPMPTRKPPVPENISLTPDYKKINIKWKSMDDTLSYNIYYKKAGDQEYEKIEEIKTASYVLNDLEEQAEYEIMISGQNHLGEGSKSGVYKAQTIDLVAPNTRNYKLINTSNGTGNKTEHIVSVTKGGGTVPNEFALVDDDYKTCWTLKSWDAGGYNANDNVAATVKFDKAYKMSSVIIVGSPTETQSYFYYRVNYWKDGVKKTINRVQGVPQKTAPNGKTYYEITFGTPIEADTVQVCLANYSSSGSISIAELRFYEYDSLEDDVKALFKDNLRIELADDVTLEKIEGLEARANTLDPISKEYHPNQEIILKDLEYAKQILKDKAISDVIEIDQNVNVNKTGYLGFSYDLNDMQPLGITANAGDKIAVYVGAQNDATAKNLEVVFTQYFPEWSKWKSSSAILKNGQNIIDVPQLTQEGVEKGGAVYIRYKNKTPGTTPIKVRVSGGQKIPVLDIHGLTDETEIKNKINTYITELKDHVEKLPTYYQEKGQTYVESTSILNSTDIVLDDVMLSIPASKALSGITSKAGDQVDTVYNTTKAFEEIVGIFYKEKGLSKDSTDEKNKWPSARLNIRYTRMFDGAFMYASSGHIGIGLGSCSSLMQGTPSVKNEDGSYTVGNRFGWGIWHEIGHVIDQKQYASAETTNNIYALLAQTADDKALSRLESSGKYESIYRKVTSHTTGTSGDVFTSLGMYWQLHLAYDDGATLEAKDTFYARLHTLYRNDTIGNTMDKHEKLICYASDSAKKDLTEYFEAWGLQVTEKVMAYIQQKGYEKETRPIYYINDEARRYRINKGTALGKYEVNAELEEDSTNKTVKLTFNLPEGADASKLLGYEIIRNGESIGFTTTNDFTDELNALNNRVLNYEVVAYDKLLNEVGKKVLEAVKIENDGTIMDKGAFKASSNMRNEADPNEYETEDVVIGSIKNVLDGDANTTFNGNTRKTSTDKTTPYIMLELNNTLPVCAIRYTAGVENGKLVENTLKKYKISAYAQGTNGTYSWVQVKSGTLNLTASNPVAEIFFDEPGSTGGKQLYTTNVGYIKIEAEGASGISAAEFDIISPAGDNISIEADKVYILGEDYKYAEKDEDVIKAGSIVFEATYRGNPAYNAALLINGKNEVIENNTHLAMAEIPEGAGLNEIREGTWLIYMTQEAYQEILDNGEAKAKIELYRVNEANTLKGQRLVSDTLYIDLKPITELKTANIQGNEQ